MCLCLCMYMEVYMCVGVCVYKHWWIFFQINWWWPLICGLEKELCVLLFLWRNEESMKGGGRAASCTCVWVLGNIEWKIQGFFFLHNIPNKYIYVMDSYREWICFFMRPFLISRKSNKCSPVRSLNRLCFNNNNSHLWAFSPRGIVVNILHSLCFMLITSQDGH